MIPDLAKRLGVESEKITRKALEYERLIQLKASAASGYQIKGIAQLVICIDLAAKADNVNLEMETLLKLSGLKKPAYNATKQTVKQVLGIFEDLPLKDVCVQFGCPEIVADVENLLQMYCKQSCNGQQDLDHPGFKAAAIMAVSKVNKLRVERGRLHEMSGLKKTVFDKLVLAMTVLQQANKTQEIAATTKTKATKRPQSFIETVEAKAKALDDEYRVKEEDTCVPKVDFAAWKRRMLEEGSQ